MPIMSALANPTQSQGQCWQRIMNIRGLHYTCIKLLLFEHKNKTENGNPMTGLYV